MTGSLSVNRCGSDWHLGLVQSVGCITSNIDPNSLALTRVLQKILGIKLGYTHLFMAVLQDADGIGEA